MLKGQAGERECAKIRVHFEDNNRTSASCWSNEQCCHTTKRFQVWTLCRARVGAAASHNLKLIYPGQLLFMSCLKTKSWAKKLYTSISDSTYIQSLIAPPPPPFAQLDSNLLLRLTPALYSRLPLWRCRQEFFFSPPLSPLCLSLSPTWTICIWSSQLLCSGPQAASNVAYHEPSAALYL